MLRDPHPFAAARAMLIICPTCISTYRLTEGSSATRPTKARCAQCREVFDVDPVTAVVAPSASTGALTAPASRITVPPIRLEPVALQGMRSVRVLRASRPSEGPRERSAARALAAVALCLGLSMAVTAFRGPLLAAMPGVAAVLGVARSDGLSLHDVQTALADEGSTKVLTLEGRISNDRTHEAPVPDLRIVVRDGSAQTVYSWTTPSPRASLAPGEAVAFRSRLVAPPSEGHDLVVSFADATDDARAIRVKDLP